MGQLFSMGASGFTSRPPRCQFSNKMSSSQFKCRRDVIYDMKVRIRDLSTRTARQTCLRPRVLRGVSSASCVLRRAARTKNSSAGDSPPPWWRRVSRAIRASASRVQQVRPTARRWRDHEWENWWGDEPPFHTAVFVMTHHERPSFTLSDNTFHFVSGDPATILERAREAAQGKDVRLGGGATSSGSSSTRTSSTPSMWRCPRGWRSAPDRACGSHLRSCSTGSTMRLCRARAA